MGQTELPLDGFKGSPEQPFKPLSFEEADTRGGGTFYHGAADEFKLEEGGEYAGDKNIYGQGLYTTDDLVTAKSYKNKNKAKDGSEQAPSVYQVDFKEGDFFDLDTQKIPDNLIEQASSYPDNYLDWLDDAWKR